MRKSIVRHFRKALNLPDFLIRSRPCRVKYGLIPGLRLALRLRQASYAGLAGEEVALCVPGLSAPVYLRCGTTDSDVFRQIFLEDSLRVTSARSARFVIDAGAYTGLSSIFLSMVFPRATIVALELERSNYELLERNTAPYPQIIPLHRGLWFKRTRLKTTNSTGLAWSFSALESNREDNDAVEAVGIADLLQEFNQAHIDFLKVDVEGAEREIFSTNADAWIDLVRAMAIELHDRRVPGCYDAVQKAIMGRGFTSYRQGEYDFFAHGNS